MTAKVPLTRLELKRRREALNRYERFLPALKRKQQQLQLSLQELDAVRRGVAHNLSAARHAFGKYRAVLHDIAGIDLLAHATPLEVMTGEVNIAGVRVPVFRSVSFMKANYSLFATPPWVDRALIDLRDLTRFRVELSVLNRQRELLSRELMRIVQRVNLFEKVLIPDAGDAIRRIRIHLGDEMTAAVGRAKIAKGRLVTDVIDSGRHGPALVADGASPSGAASRSGATAPAGAASRIGAAAPAGAANQTGATAPAGAGSPTGSAAPSDGAGGAGA
jgi:V/A-type H+/Na+-transporting ATPase subunit D